jgi:hypothetical protein
VKVQGIETGRPTGANPTLPLPAGGHSRCVEWQVHHTQLAVCTRVSLLFLCLYNRRQKDEGRTS